MPLLALCRADGAPGDVLSLAVPDTVTDPFVTAPGSGESTVTTGAVVSTVHVRVATVEMFPTASTARTLNV